MRQSLLLIIGTLPILAGGCFRQALNADPSNHQTVLNRTVTKSNVPTDRNDADKKYAARRVTYHDDHATDQTFADHQSNPSAFQLTNQEHDDVFRLMSELPNDKSSTQANQNPIDFEIFDERRRDDANAAQFTTPTERNLFETLISDQREFYSGKNLQPMLMALGASAVLSNTEMDQNFSQWYQSDVRSSGSDGISEYAKHFGEHWHMVGIYFSSSLVGRIQGPNSTLATWGDRSIRSTLVGFPPLLALQKAIGSTRPNDTPASSRWNFNGDDNGASGHTFIGAIPFLVAAQMTDERLPKATLLALSTVPGWSRINDDHHYLSQVVVGWCLAYIATESIHRTEIKLGFQIEPMFAPDRTGFNLIWQR